VGQTPVACFVSTATNCSLNATFNGSCSSDIDVNGSIVNWTWSYTNTSQPTISVLMGYDEPLNGVGYYIFPGGDTYNVTLKVTDNDGCENTTWQNVTVGQSPVACFVSTATNCSLNATFNGSCSSDTDAGGSIANWTWSYTNTSQPTISVLMGYGEPLNGVGYYIFPGGDTYNVTLKVTDNDGCENTTWQNVTVGQSPVACFVPTATNCSLIVSFNGSCSEDPDGSITNWTWTYTNATHLTPPVLMGYDEELNNYVFPVGDTYNVTLKVTDNDGCENTTWQDVLVGQPPVACFVPNVTNCSLVASFDGSCSSDPGGSVVNWTWTYTTTTQTTPVFMDYGEELNGYVFPGEDTYTVTLKIIDNGGCENTTWQNVTVGEPPTASIEKLKYKACDLRVEFEGTGSGGAPPYTYLWEFGDGNTSTLRTLSYTYPDYGTYTVNFTVFDDNMCNDTVSRTFSLSCIKPNTSIRVYCEDDIGPKCPYMNWSDPFDPTAIQKDSLTFNPAIVRDSAEYPMSADSTDAAVKKFLRLWYECAHDYGCGDTYPTIEVESTYMLLDNMNLEPIGGSASATFFVFPIVEIEDQIGLGGFENEEGEPTRRNVVTLSSVTNEGAIGAYNKTLNGTIRIEKTYTLNKGETVQFLDHRLTYQYMVTTAEGTFAFVKVSYSGNIDDDTELPILLGKFDDGTPANPTRATVFDRHNVRFGTWDHPTRTWYARLDDYAPNQAKAQITIGKELSTCDTFYVNGVRYDVMAIEVFDSSGNGEADKFKYITVKTPLPKGEGSIPDNCIVFTQRIERIDENEYIPLNPPFNTVHQMVDDINVVLWQPTAHTDEWPVGNPAGTLGVSYFPWAERYLTMQEEKIKNEVQFGKNVGENWLDYFDDTDTSHADMKIDMDHDGKWIALDVDERILDVSELRISYLTESSEPRFTTDLYEILNETFLGQSEPPLEGWTNFTIKTRPDAYTAFELPALPDVQTPYWNKTGDYLLTSSLFAPNSVNKSDLNRTGIPRVAFAYDVEYERDALNEIAMGGDFDIYVNRYGNLVSIRIYGEDDRGPIGGYEANGSYTYDWYQDPFNPVAIQKDSITFNPAIVLRSPEYPISANGTNAAVKKFLRMWYEPEHNYSTSDWKEPTIEVESTYMLVDNVSFAPLSGSVVGGTFFVFPIASNFTTAPAGLDLFENPSSDPGRTNVVTLSYVNGTTQPNNKTVNNGSIRIQKTYTLDEGEEIQFMDFKLKYNYYTEDPVTGNKNASVVLTYVGNNRTNHPWSSVTTIVEPTEKFFDMHYVEASTPNHPYRTWYAKYEFDVPSTNKSMITVGKELRAGDIFYVDGVRYDVAAIEVIDKDGNSYADQFKYITLRTPLPKGTGDFEEDLPSSQWIDRVPPMKPLPLNPPFCWTHAIVDDIDAGGTEWSVSERIIGGYEPLVVSYSVEAIEPRYSTNLLEILEETGEGTQNLADSWTYFGIQTRPDQYTEFVLPPDMEHGGEPMHNDYLITTSFLANNSINKSDLVDPDIGIPRVAFVFDALDDTGIYINNPAGSPPVIFNEAPILNLTVNPATPVPALTTIVVCTNGTTDDQFSYWPLTIEIDWKDGTVETRTMPDEWTPICFEHEYLGSGTYNIAVTATDVYGLEDTKTHTVTITSDGCKLTLRSGWNLFSTTVSSTDNVSQIFDPNIYDWFDAVWGWNETSQDWVTLNPGDTLDPKRGYFVYCPISGEVIEINGTAAAFSDTWMTTGNNWWHLLGVGFDPVNQYGTRAYWWAPETSAYVSTYDLVPGRGYFVRV